MCENEDETGWSTFLDRLHWNFFGQFQLPDLMPIHFRISTLTL